MESLLLRDRLTLAAVLGAGIVVGVSSVYVYFKYTRTLSRDLNNLTRTIDHLSKEIQELKSNRAGEFPNSPAVYVTTKCKAENKVKPQFSSSNDFRSSVVSSSGDENEEYYDVSEESDANQSWATLNGDIALTEEWNQDFEEIDELCKGNNEQKQKAYNILINLKEQHEGNVGVMWRLAMICYLLSSIDTERKKELVFEGLKYATVALACNDQCGEAHKWYAATLGKTTDFVGIHEKIKNGYTFKKHVDEAIKYLPNDYGLYFMKGRWCYEVAMLPWIERKVASTIFATPPTSTLSEAREQFLIVEQLHPKQWKENLLYIAKCFIGEKQYGNSVKWLEEALAIECKNSEEKEVHEEVLTLNKKYESYREMT